MARSRPSFTPIIKASEDFHQQFSRALGAANRVVVTETPKTITFHMTKGPRNHASPKKGRKR